MIQTTRLVKNTAAFVIFMITTAAALYFEVSLRYPAYLADSPFVHSDTIRFISYLSFCCVVLFSLKNAGTLPLLMLLLAIKLMQFPISIFLKNFDNALYYYLCSALLDLVMAFWIVHYHNDKSLLKFFGVNTTVMVPQVYIMALLLAVSSLVSCLQAVEVVIYRGDPTFYDGGVPFLYEHQLAIKLTLKTLFDACVWSLLLDPNRWKILQKIQNKFLAP